MNNTYSYYENYTPPENANSNGVIRTINGVVTVTATLFGGLIGGAGLLVDEVEPEVVPIAKHYGVQESPSKYLYNPQKYEVETRLDLSELIEKSNSFLSLHARLDEVRRLDENWDGYGAEPIPDNVYEKAVGFLHGVGSLQISIFPTLRSSIQFEFERNDTYCEAEVFSDHIELFAEKFDVEILSENEESVEKAIEAFTGIYESTA